MKTLNKTAKLVEASTTLRLTYDSRDERFINTLDDFKACIYKRATEKDVIEQVAFYVLKYGSDRLIEGVGYISVNGVVQGEPFSGIDLETDDFNFDFDTKDDFPY